MYGMCVEVLVMLGRWFGVVDLVAIGGEGFRRDGG